MSEPKAVPFQAPQRIGQDEIVRLVGEKEIALYLLNRENARLREEVESLRRPRPVENAG